MSYQWIVEFPHNDKRHTFLLPYYVRQKRLEKDVRYFLAFLNLIGVEGTLFQNDGMIVFRAEVDTTYSNVVGFLQTQNAYHQKTDLMNGGSVINLHKGFKVIVIGAELKTAVCDLLKAHVEWSWFESPLAILGPVSCFLATSPKYGFDVALFGDVHDNFIVPGLFDHRQVRDFWDLFFGAAKSFYNEAADFEQFTFIVNKMKLDLYAHRPEYSRQLFIWEFLVDLLHMFSLHQTCVDVIVEDPLDMDYDSTVPTNYLEAVRYLFQICPLVESSDSPFLHFLPQCSALFPNLRYHRIDLRFALYEHPKGNFENGANIKYLKSILRTKSIDLLPQRIDTMLAYHVVNNVDDRKLLKDELTRMYKQFLQSKLVFNLKDFYRAFRDATVSFTEHARSPWFFMRTCITDIYGLSRLYRTDRKLESKTNNKICGAKGPRKVICYLGDYHAVVWRKVITALDSEDILVYKDHMRAGLKREIKFDRFSRKPLMGSEWNDGHAVFKESIGNMHRVDKELFVSLISQATERGYYLPYLTTSANSEILEDEEPHVFLNGSPVPIPQRVADLKLARQEIKATCKDDNDVFLNEFDDMDSDEIKTIYTKNMGQSLKCYSASTMAKIWISNYEEGKVFRDPLTNLIVPDSETQQIVKLARLAVSDIPVRNPRNIVDKVVIYKPKAEYTHGMLRVIVVLDGKQYFVTWFKFQRDAGIQFKSTVLYRLKRAISEVVTYAPIEFDLINNLIFLEGVHFNNFRTVSRWLEPNAQLDLQQELAPYTSIDFTTILLHDVADDSEKLDNSETEWDDDHDLGDTSEDTDEDSTDNQTDVQDSPTYSPSPQKTQKKTPERTPEEEAAYRYHRLLKQHIGFEADDLQSYSPTDPSRSPRI